MPNEKDTIDKYSCRQKYGESQLEQCLADSLCGAHSSQRVMEESIKVSLGRMEIVLDVQRHKLA